MKKVAYLGAPSFGFSDCFRLLSAALLLKDDFDCCLPVVGIALAEALDSAVLAIPLTIAAAMMERGFPPSATTQGETWRPTEPCRFVEEAVLIRAAQDQQWTICFVPAVKPA